jgi:hypothetical protein
MISRRSFVLRLSGLVALSIVDRRLAAQVGGKSGLTALTVYKSSSCACCTKWVEHIRQNGFEPVVHDEEDMDAIKAQLHVPADVRSCHTAIAGKYLIEGHVPASDIKRLLKEQPALSGLAVPGMPSDTPGMAPPGAKIAGFDVLSFQPDGSTKVFSSY